MGKGEKEKEGYSLVKLANQRMPFQLSYMNLVTNWGSSLQYLDSEMRRNQEGHTLVAAQDANGEVAEDKDQYFVCEDIYFVPRSIGAKSCPSFIVTRGPSLQSLRLAIHTCNRSIKPCLISIFSTLIT
jgi:hypothetical protein